MLLKGLINYSNFSLSHWNKLSWLEKWLVSIRAPSLTPTLGAVALAGVLAIGQSNYNLAVWFFSLVALLLLHASFNLINDYSDYNLGYDQAGRLRLNYANHPLAQGYLKPREFVFSYLLPTITASTILSLLILLDQDQAELVWLVFILGVVIGCFFSLPLGKWFIREFLVSLVWGPFIIAVGYYTITETWSNYVLIASLPYGLSVGLIWLAKHFDKQRAAEYVPANSLLHLLGLDQACRLARFSLVAIYLLLFMLYLSGFFQLIAFAVLGSLSSAQKLFQALRLSSFAKLKNNKNGKSLLSVQPDYYTNLAARFNLQFGLFYWLAIFLNLLLS